MTPRTLGSQRGAFCGLAASWGITLLAVAVFAVYGLTVHSDEVA